MNQEELLQILEEIKGTMKMNIKVDLKVEFKTHGQEREVCHKQLRDLMDIDL